MAGLIAQPTLQTNLMAYGGSDNPPDGVEAPLSATGTIRGKILVPPPGKAS